MDVNTLGDCCVLMPQPRSARATFDCAGAKFFFVFSVFDDHAVLCAVKSDKQKFNEQVVSKPNQAYHREKQLKVKTKNLV